MEEERGIVGFYLDLGWSSLVFFRMPFLLKREHLLKLREG